LYRIVLTNRAAKGLDSAPQHVQKRIGEALDALRESFAPVKLFDVKKLKGLEDTFRIRIGDWRMIYEFRRKESTIVVLDIAPRGKAY
jgi:mRNA interferase RelE/StbE